MSRWKQVPLGDLCTFQRGLTYSKSDEVEYSTNGVLRANNIDLSTNELNLREIRYISDSIRVPDSKKARQGALLICTASGSRSHLGKVALVDEDYDLAFGGFMGLITPNVLIESRYLYYAMIGERFQEKLGSLAGGTNINNLKFKDICDFPVPLPSLEDQRRIVAVLDDAFAAIATATANAEKNLANAQELFEVSLDRTFTINSAGWDVGCIAELCVVGDGNHSSKYPKNSEMVPKGIPFLRSTNIQRGAIVLDDVLYISASKHTELKKGHLRHGDVLFTNRGEIGKVAIVPEILDDSNLNSQIAWLRCQENILPEYLYFFLQSGKMRAHFNLTQSGSALQQFTIRMLKNVLISYPTRVEQERIVEIIREVSAKTKRLEEISASKLASLNRLKQALLSKAFDGELAAREKEPIAA